MKHNYKRILTAALAVFAALMSGCVQEELPDNRETSYGYVQFKLYKESAYGTISKAIVEELPSMSAVSKVRVELQRGAQTISQTLTLTASDNNAAEFGLRSSKLRLLSGTYKVTGFTLFDAMDKELYLGETPGKALEITPGGMTIYDLTAKAAGRGSVIFTFVKDTSAFTPKTSTKSTGEIKRQYTLDEIATVSLELRDENNPSAQAIKVEDMSVDFIEDFSGEQHYDGNDGVVGHQTSYLECDSLIFLPAGEYKILQYTVLDEEDNLLETKRYDSNELASAESFVIEDNRTAEVDVPITLYEEDRYIQEYYKLKELWLALDGPNWSYTGESWPAGCNWDFDKDIDLWGDQPGVKIHPNGRIASIDFSGFGIKGECPAAIGEFTQLIQLYFGNHNEANNHYGHNSAAAAAYPINGSQEEKALWREKVNKAYRDELHPAYQMSPVCALALRLNGQESPAASSYANLTDDELSRLSAGGMKQADYSIELYDMNPGVLTNGLTKLPEELGNLKKLETLSIANAPIKADGFPSAAAMSRLTSVTDLEIYNCPNLGELPAGVASMPSVISFNFSNNGFSAEKAKSSLIALAKGASKDKLQILYYLENGLTELPAELGELSDLGMLDIARNEIGGTLPAFGDSFAPEEIILDNNKIKSIPDGFCSLDFLDSFSANNNELTEFPNIFSSKKNIIMTSISVAHNKITKLPEDFNGLRTVTLTLSGNPIKTFPKELAATDSYVEQIVMQQCGMEEFPEKCLNGKYTSSITVIDVQFNNLTDLPDDFNAEAMPYLYGVDLSSNSFSKFPFEPLNAASLTAYSIRGQRDKSTGARSLREWPTGLWQHTGLRGFYIGANDLRVISDDISTMIFYLDISDNPNIVFDASDICAAWQAGTYFLYYDRTQNIQNCDAMKE